MKEVYVHNNPSSLIFNTHLLVFVRTWHMPWSEGDDPMPDTWLRVPAHKAPGIKDRDRYVCYNSNLEITSPIVIAEEDMVVIKAGRAKPYKLVPLGLMQATLAEAFDVPAWEFENKQSWPYKEMFDPEAVRRRYAQLHGDSAATFMSVAPTNRIYNLVRRTALPTPCRSCGKGRARGRR